MTKDQIILYLIRDGTIVKISEDNYEFSKNNGNLVPTKNIRNEGLITNPSKLLDQFIHDSKIPFNVKTSSGITYPPTAKSEYAKKFIYNELVVSPRFKYADMIKATELYYNNPKMARVPITKYFKEGIFEQVIEEYLKGNMDKGTAKVNKVSL